MLTCCVIGMLKGWNWDVSLRRFLSDATNADAANAVFRCTEFIIHLGYRHNITLLHSKQKSLLCSEIMLKVFSIVSDRRKGHGTALRNDVNTGKTANTIW